MGKPVFHLCEVLQYNAYMKGTDAFLYLLRENVTKRKVLKEKINFICDGNIWKMRV